MKKLFESWKSFLTEDELLAEGRLEDTKNKYSELSKDGWIDKLSNCDQSGINKYLMWMAKQLENSRQAESGSNYLNRIKERICDESGQIRRFVNIFVNAGDIRFKEGAKTAVSDGAEVETRRVHCSRFANDAG